MNKILIGVFIILTNLQPVFAQKSEKEKLVSVSGRAELLLEDADCIGSAKRKVEDLAKVDALEKAFGRVIVQGNNTYIENSQTGERVLTTIKMSTIAESKVRGQIVEVDQLKVEWVLRDQPGASSRDKRQELWLICQLEGKAREMTGASIQLDAVALKCDNSEACITNEFKSGDRAYIRFKTPVAGYLSVFILDTEENTVFRLLPYTRMSGEYESALPVQSDTEYLFFSEKYHRNYFPTLSASILDPIAFATTQAQIFNRIYIVFSPKPFNKPLLKSDPQYGGIKTIAPADFQKWVSINQTSNKDFIVDVLDISVAK